jgi:hypothetical protein
VDVEMIAGEHVQGGVGRKAKPERPRVVRIDINGRKRIGLGIVVLMRATLSMGRFLEAT